MTATDPTTEVIQGICRICGHGCCNCDDCVRLKGFMDTCGEHSLAEEMTYRAIFDGGAD
jgi:hypothetical protein